LKHNLNDFADYQTSECHTYHNVRHFPPDYFLPISPSVSTKHHDGQPSYTTAFPVTNLTSNVKHTY
jgi:hypothetical protein